MALTVVLVRHGDAKGKRLGQTDFERELTQVGMDALEEAFPRSLAMVDVTDKTELWVSTAIRAQQTADIANKTLGIQTRRAFDDMYEQDQEAFFKELAQTDADVVVAIGHIPFMEDVAARLCGTFLNIATGGVAAIALDDKACSRLTSGMARGRLLWFVQGPRV